MATGQIKWPEGDGGWQGLDGSEEGPVTGVKASKQNTHSCTESLGTLLHGEWKNSKRTAVRHTRICWMNHGSNDISSEVAQKASFRVRVECCAF